MLKVDQEYETKEGENLVQIIADRGDYFLGRFTKFGAFQDSLKGKHFRWDINGKSLSFEGPAHDLKIG